jgi:hypothetical protein
VVGFSADTKTWQAVPAVNGPVLAGNLLAGTYVSGGLVHVVTRRVGELALFAPGRWGDPRLVSRRPPVLRGVAAVRVSRQRDGTVLVMTRLSTSSQVQLTARATRGSLLRRGSQLARAVLRSGGFPVRFRLGGRSLVRGSIAGVRIAAVDPWGRRGAFTLSFRVP